MRQFIDLSGQKFNKLTVIKRAADYISPNNKKILRWLCECECGNTITVFSSDLKRGNVKSCGCSRYNKRKTGEQKSKTGEQKSRKGKTRLIDFTGKRFGILTVIKRGPNLIEPNGHNVTTWLCKCDCGNEKVIRAKSLKSGETTSCGCIMKQTRLDRAIAHRRDIEGNRYGLLTAIKRVGTDDSRKQSLWLCKCDCGNDKIIRMADLVSGRTKSCGCLHSMMEAETEKYLQNWKIKHKWHHSPRDLKTSRGGFCEFDFLISYDCNCFAYIECQGEQHYIDKGEFGRLEREETDKLKREYCERKGIPLFEIRYDENVEVRLREILDTLHANPVPDAAQSAA